MLVRLLHHSSSTKASHFLHHSEFNSDQYTHQLSKSHLLQDVSLETSPFATFGRIVLTSPGMGPGGLIFHTVASTLSYISFVERHIDQGGGFYFIFSDTVLMLYGIQIHSN